MVKKIRFILVFMSLSICLCLMSTTYSRYVADATSNIEVLFARWQILVNDSDITSNKDSTISFIPVIEENEHVASDAIAPSSKGYFDIDVNPVNVEVSFKYSITLEMANENIPDLMITKYAFIPNDYIEGDPLDIINLNDNSITDNLYFDKNADSFQFEPFTIRIYFEWYEGENELMNDEDDTAIGNMAATENTTFKINANISFEQLLE
ncbi:MAG TPA: hypothetical protein GXZ95_02630 [Mollicutes bacterium]|nr:hypothetical protein [Mollicutes bacterium]